MVSPRGIRAGAAYVELYARDNRLVRGLRRAQRRLRAFGAGVRRIGANLAKVSAVMATPFAGGVKVYADFEKQLANVSTMLDEPEKHMGRFKDAIRDMSVEFGESTGALAGGLYDILSASIPAQKALDVLAVAVRAAKAGMTDTKTAADAITTVLNSYGLAAEHAGSVSDMLFTVVKRGKTTFAELAPQIGMVASTASSAGVGLNELGASLATLTRAGVKTENAVTAVNQIVMSFLKPAREATEYAEKLGFRMSSATLKSEGLAGVFERISKLPPDAIAKLFPNVRALRGVIPALKNMSGFSDDIAAMARRAGATGVAYEKMTKTLSHAFNRLKQSALVSLSLIGEALAEPLSKAAKALKKYMKSFAGWIKNNKEAVVMIAKVIAVTAAAGIALMALGGVISALGAALGALASIATTVVTAFGMLMTVLGAILSPIGMVITAVAALGAYILYATGAAAKALGWLGGKFEDLKKTATGAIQGISDALAAGDIALAAKVLWLSLKLAWGEGTKELRLLWAETWGKLKTILSDGWHGMRLIHEKAVHRMTRSFIDGIYGWKVLWADFWSWLSTNMQEAAAGWKIIWEDIKHLAGKTTEKEHFKAVNKIIQDSNKARKQNEADRRKAVRDAVSDHNRMAELADSQHKKNVSNIIDESNARRKAIEDEAAASKEQTKERLKKARQEWREAIDAAKDKRKVEQTQDEGPGKMKSPEDVLEQVKKSMKGMGEALGGAARKTVGVTGTFNVAGVLGLQAGGAEDRIANAAENTAVNTKKILDEIRQNMPAFD